MAGIYLHIPFCKQACHYCDFHFSTNLSNQEAVIQAMVHELSLRKNYLQGETITSVYLGGGTPSLLTPDQLQLLFQTIQKHFNVDTDAEITLEANPDDLSVEKLKALKHSPVNRLSIGVQTFDDERLKFINRAHTRDEAINALTNAKEAGFENITADLIYAIPPADMDYWEKDLIQMLEFDLPHLSLYGLTIEEKTAFGVWKKRGKLVETDEDTSARQYQRAIELLTSNGYEHYEVSNFAKAGMYSRHNSAYWDDQNYLGIGPGAHSYNGQERAFNVSHNIRYLKALERNEPPLTVEHLSEIDQLNEYVFTHLRTKKGISIPEMRSRFGKSLIEDFGPAIQKYMDEGLMLFEHDRLALTSEGFMLADEISLQLFYTE